jgi:hypothetical protein
MDGKFRRRGRASRRRQGRFCGVVAQRGGLASNGCVGEPVMVKLWNMAGIRFIS